MIYDILICPKCGQALVKNGQALICENKHTYDFSSSGYINLNTRHSISGDSPDMVKARSRFLDGGYYDKFLTAVKNNVFKYSPEYIVDAGCGEGYYSANIVNSNKDVKLFGFDLSKSAVTKASKRVKGKNNNALFMVCGIFGMPLKDNSVDVVMSLFAPIANEEFARIMKDRGHLIVCAAGKDHLIGLKNALYDDVYLNNPEKICAPAGFVEVSRENVKYSVKIKDNQHIKDLFSMTPYFWKTSESDASKLDNINELETILDFDIIVFERTQSQK